MTEQEVRNQLEEGFKLVRPKVEDMSSMTVEESKELADIYEKMKKEYLIGLDVDFLNSHHFDYRGLIDKGLAIEAPEGMYNLKECII